ncbi:MAG: hypothetical protein BWY44_00142 [Candidatus Omnitrophica bacterium ADurb.Bin292]|nr:MAG: hypothetical protein BWY44_00142 [Candidatus Omnitrophica bacterium ADurb.Bin292]
MKIPIKVRFRRFSNLSAAYLKNTVGEQSHLHAIRQLRESRRLRRIAAKTRSNKDISRSLKPGPQLFPEPGILQTNTVALRKIQINDPRPLGNFHLVKITSPVFDLNPLKVRQLTLRQKNNIRTRRLTTRNLYLGKTMGLCYIPKFS